MFLYILLDPINEASRCWLTEESQITYPLVVKNINVDVARRHTQVFPLIGLLHACLCTHLKPSFIL